MSAAIGIDFGTSCLRVAVLKDGKPQMVGGPIPIWQAAGFSQDLGVDLQLKTKLHDPTPVTVAGQRFERPALALRVFQVARAQAEQVLGQGVDSCVLCVPSRAGVLLRESFRQVLRDAGFKTMRLLNKPAAVALSQSRPVEGERTILIFNLGSGSLDVNVAVRTPRGYTSLASGGSEQISGQQFTSRLSEYLLDQFRLRTAVEIRNNGLVRARVLDEAERVKVLLSSQDEVEVDLPRLQENGPDEWLDLKMTVPRDQFEGLIAQPVMDSLNICQQLLTDLHLSPSKLHETWLAGGSCAIPAIQKALAEWLGKPPSIANEFAAAFGAALYTVVLDLAPAVPEQKPVEKPALPLASPISNVDAENTAQAMIESDRLLKTGDFEGALQQLGLVNILLQQKRARVMFEQGLSRENARDYTSAKQYYLFANKIDRMNEEYKEALRRIQRQEAREVYQKAHDLAAAGDLDKASKEYRLCAELDPDNYDYSVSYARCVARLALKKRDAAVNVNSINMRMLSEAQKLLNRALSIAPNDIKVNQQLKAFSLLMSALAIVYGNDKGKAKDYRKVVDLLQRAFEIDSGDMFINQLLYVYLKKL